jgi:hypothetical protein
MFAQMRFWTLVPRRSGPMHSGGQLGVGRCCSSISDGNAGDIAARGLTGNESVTDRAMFCWPRAMEGREKATQSTVARKVVSCMTLLANGLLRERTGDWMNIQGRPFSVFYSGRRGIWGYESHELRFVFANRYRHKSKFGSALTAGWCLTGARSRNCIKTAVLRMCRQVSERIIVEN